MAHGVEIQRQSRKNLLGDLNLVSSQLPPPSTPPVSGHISMGWMVGRQAKSCCTAGRAENAMCNKHEFRGRLICAGSYRGVGWDLIIGGWDGRGYNKATLALPRFPVCLCFPTNHQLQIRYLPR
jgi:hypothetical protein